MSVTSPSYQLSQMGLSYDDLESGQGPGQGHPELQIQDRVNAMTLIGLCIDRDRKLDAGEQFPDLLNTSTIQSGGPMFFPRLIHASQKAYEDYMAAKRDGNLYQTIILWEKMNATRRDQGLPDVPPIVSYYDIIKGDKGALGFNARWLEDQVAAGKAVDFWADPVATLRRAGVLASV
jgi:hypothetical protein